jgi:nicotinic acid mononucleotide adenylyltransferase
MAQLATSVSQDIDYRPDNTIIFTIARMNPPTPGHLEVIRSLIAEAMSKSISRVFVILSKTKDNVENPIFCQEKINALKIMIDILQKRIGSHVEVVLICVPDVKGATPYTSIINIVNLPEFASLPDLNLILVIGVDRSDMGESIRKYFVGKTNVKSVESKILPRSDMSIYKALRGRELCETVMSTIPPSALSASFVRNVVRDCPQEKFIELYAPYLDPEQISILYTALRNGLGIKGGKRRRTRKSNKKRKTIRNRRKTIRRRLNH